MTDNTIYILSAAASEDPELLSRCLHDVVHDVTMANLLVGAPVPEVKELNQAVLNLYELRRG